jgi:hypothetical protein
LFSCTIRFFDLDISLQSDTSVIIDKIAGIYRRFLVSEGVLPVRFRSELVYLSSSASSPHQPTLFLDGVAQPLSINAQNEGYIYGIVLSILLNRVRSHYLIHAGAVTRQRQAVILAADTQHGKSTLTLELVRRGYKFLSDEFAAINRANGRIDPFPRCLRLCPDTLDRLGFQEIAKHTPIWLEKTLIDIEDIIPGSLGTAAEIGHVIVLRDPSGLIDTTAAKDGRWLSVCVERTNDAFLNDLEKNNAIQRLETDLSGEYPILQMIVKSKQVALPEIEAICRQHNILLNYIVTRKNERPSFNQPVRMTEIPKSKMAMELVKRLMGGRQIDLIQDDLGGDYRQLFLQLTGYLKSARCWELSVGPLEQMADLIYSLPESA